MPSKAQFFPAAGAANGVELLHDENLDEVLSFLGRHPIQTVAMAGLIHDNGLQSPLNRGAFYGCRDYLGQLEGVALIGHATLMETDSDRALKAFAQTAQGCTSAHLIMCKEDSIDKFWGYYAETGQEMRRVCRELLFELRWPIDVSSEVPRLRLATVDDLDLLIPVHAEMAFEESGIDPRNHDAQGFANRYARRISQGRTWVLTQDKKLIFKAEVMSDTPEATYIEGVWVNPEARREGHGRICMSELARTLLWRTKSLCLFVNNENQEAQRFYKQSGYHLRSVYDTVFLK
ncbi:MAG TPA: GNAT family N-acetyltransferase [Pyrinomonadaceae bacterium]|nr:GNAT family N-acetyltransferase [Pyrinomonadaceae bacterium]